MQKDSWFVHSFIPPTLCFKSYKNPTYKNDFLETGGYQASERYKWAYYPMFCVLFYFCRTGQNAKKEDCNISGWHNWTIIAAHNIIISHFICIHLETCICRLTKQANGHQCHESVAYCRYNILPGRKLSPFPVSLPPESQWQISFTQDLLGEFCSYQPSNLLCLARKSQVCSLPQSASMSALVLTNILSAGVPADWNHKAILGNLKPMSTISHHNYQFGAPESCS